MPGLPERIAHYRVLELIGRGGMGDIYTAEDERLHRTVALKMITPGLLQDDTARRRLLDEARAAARFTHPFICAIHEVLDVSGQPIIVMEYVEGETIASRVRPGPMPHRDVCRIASEVAEALGVAHALGLVHRDISAANVMISRSGHAKVMDFGLARFIAPVSPAEATRTIHSVTGPMIVGTPAYLAPEVLRGQGATPSSDLYAFGVVMYLMATARLPFPNAATDAELVADILTRTPVAPRSIVPALPRALEQIITRLLEKDPAHRYASADDVRRALGEAVDAHGPAHDAQSVAVLPFKALGQGIDPDLGVGLADATITDLAAVKSLLVRPTSVIVRYRDGEVDPVQAGRELSVDVVVAGSVHRSGSRARVTVQVLRTSDGRSEWGTKIDASLDDVFRLQDEVSQRIRLSLETHMRPSPREDRPAPSSPLWWSYVLPGAARKSDPEPVADISKPEAAAHEHYVRGRLHLMHENVESLQAAAQEFERALEIDPRFAKALVGLAGTYARTAFTFKPDEGYYERAQELIDRALAIDPGLPEARFTRGWLLWTPVAGFRHEAAIRELNAAIVSAPGLYEAHDLLGIVLLHVSLLDLSAKELERAIAINPNDQFAFLHYGLSRYYAGEWAQALEISEEAWRRMPSAWAGYQLALTQVQLGRFDEAQRTAAAAVRHFPGDVLFYPLAGLIAALRGEDADAARQIELTVANKKAFGHYHHAQYDVACIHALAGRRDEAMRWLTAAARNGFPCHVFFTRDRMTAPLHDLPEFRTLVAQLEDHSKQCLRAYRETRESTG